jgi:hypothetical protein
MRSCSRVASQLLSRASSGWAEVVGWSRASVLLAVLVARVLEGPTPERRVSCRPGAEGADADWRWVKEEVCASAGTMRRD